MAVAKTMCDDAGHDRADLRRRRLRKLLSQCRANLVVEPIRFGADAAVGAVGPVFLLVIASALGLLCVKRDEFYGSTAFYDESDRVHRVGQEVMPVSITNEDLADGSVCTATKDLSPGVEVECFTAENARKLRTVEPQHHGKCCTGVRAGSAREALAGLRRFMTSWRSVGQLILTPAALILGTLLALVGVTVAMLVPAGAAVFVAAAAFGSGRGMRILARTLFPISVRSTARDVPRDDNNASLVAVHFSDLHVLGLQHYPVELQDDPGAPARADIENSLRAAVDHVLAVAPPAVIITGDITDTGATEEWDRATDLLVELRSTSDVIAVPGNHDTTIRYEISRGRGVPAHGGGWLWHRDRRQEQDDWDRRRACYSALSTIMRGKSAEVVDFPFRRRVRAGDQHVTVIGLDSTRYPSRWLISNAVGEFGAQQLRTMQALLPASDEPVIVAFHHHLGWPSDVTRDVMDLAMVPVDARPLLRILRSHVQRTGAPVLVLHGHKHMAMEGVVDGGIVVSGATSVGLGACLQPDGLPNGRSAVTRVYFAPEQKQWIMKRQVVAERCSNCRGRG